MKNEKSLKGYVIAKETKGERMQVLIRPTTKDALKNEAKNQNRSVNDIVNEVLENYLGLYK